mmetsp:Transcript_27108/g.43758  ORF Transcript_27108/g.43758 Transcript_27108/m.43758 type:complete len:255 (-) Transcript_27108:170-934(-)
MLVMLLHAALLHEAQLLPVVFAAGPMRGLRRGQQGPGAAQLLGEIQGTAGAHDALGHHEDGVRWVLGAEEDLLLLQFQALEALRRRLGCCRGRRLVADEALHVVQQEDVQGPLLIRLILSQLAGLGQDDLLALLQRLVQGHEDLALRHRGTHHAVRQQQPLRRLGTQRGKEDARAFAFQGEDQQADLIREGAVHAAQSAQIQADEARALLLHAGLDALRRGEGRAEEGVAVERNGQDAVVHAVQVTSFLWRSYH